jgi:hypothetical protein
MKVDGIWCHPENLERLKRELGHGPYFGVPLFATMPLYTSSALPRRFTKEIWHPPAESRFAEYGPEDEVWMRPLGLGRIEVKDNGPAYYSIAAAAISSSLFGDAL